MKRAKIPPSAGINGTYYKQVPSKTQVPGIMVTAAMAKPNAPKNFDGKIGLWRSAENYKAKRDSKNHKKGDVYLKGVTVNGDRFYDLIVDSMMPAIRDKMPWASKIMLQYDNARAHIKKKDGKTMKGRPNIEGAKHNPVIEIADQVQRSPDTNICDLTIFAAWVHQVWKRLGRHDWMDRGALWGYVQDEFENLPKEIISRGCVNKSPILDQIIRAKGGNFFEVPHVGAAARAARIPHH